MSEVEPNSGQQSNQSEHQANLNSEPLGLLGKALSLLFAPLLIPMIPIVAGYWLYGRKRKSKDVRNFMELGWLLWGAIFALIYFLMK